MYRRHIEPILADALADTPVVFLGGARQTGKSTLAAKLVADGVLDEYVTLDDATALAAATADPTAFVRGLPDGVVIDEVQHAPGLFRAIKSEVDRGRRPGRFLLTGSANVLVVPGLSQELVGRVEISSLWPLSQGELAGRPETFLSWLFSDSRRRWEATADEADILRRISVGGFPEATQRSARRRAAWFESYLTTIMQRDVRDLASINNLGDLSRLFVSLAARLCGLLNLSDVARDCGIPQTTLKRYVSLLRATHLIQLIPAWTPGVGQRIVKAPKVLLSDTGLAAHLLGVSPLRRAQREAGALVEAFVILELQRQASWHAEPIRLHHFRAHSGQEVDLVIEHGDRRVVGVEVKLSSQVSTSDLRGLHRLREVAPRFHRGVILYMGEQTVTVADGIVAVPLSAVWQ